MLVVGTLAALPLNAETRAFTFTPTGWNPAEWTLIKSPYDAHVGKWIQKDDHLQNEVPADATPAEWQGKRAAECYTSMVYNTPVTGDAKITSTMAFTPEMAPLIVLAKEVGQDAAGHPEYREYWEICVYNKGVNVWHHTYTDGKPHYQKACYARFPLKADTKYELEVERKGQQLIVRIDGHEFGYQDATLPATYRVGITGCEGLNRFYDFSVNGKLAPAP